VKLTKKYDYASLKKEEGETRLYLTPDGESLPSVTSVLSKTKDKEFLRRWKQRVGDKKAQKILDESSRIGTALHLFIERFVNDTGYKDLTKIGVKAEQMAQIIIEQGLKDVNEVWGSEVHLYYPGKYAGTTDMVGLYKGRPAIIDFKQTNRPKKREWIQDYLMQLSAYGMAHNKIFGTDIDQGIIMMCSRDLTYQIFELTGENWRRSADTFMKRLDKYLSLII
jgi:genome maintenance exonuclease 1